jgi:hypothetical protein
MATDMILSPPVPVNPTPEIESGKSGPSAAASSAKARTGRASNKVEGESFLTTLKKAARDRNIAENPRPVGKAKRIASKALPSKNKMDEASDSASEQNEEPSAVAQPGKNGEAGQSDPIPIIGNLMDFFKILEEMGLRYCDGGSDGKPLMDGDLTDGENVAGLNLKMLMDRLQQGEPVPSAELEAAFERLQQFIAQAMEDNSATVVEGNAGNGRSINQLPDLPRIFLWLKNLAAGLHQQSNDNGGVAGAGSTAAGPSDATISGAGDSLEAVADSIELFGHSKAGSRLQSADNAGTPLEPAKKEPVNPGAAMQAGDSAKKEKDAEKTDGDSNGSKAAVPREMKTDGLARTTAQMPAARDRMPSDTGTANLEHRSPKQSPAASCNPGNASNPDNASAAPAAEGTAVKVLQESQAVKDGGVKLSGGIIEDNSGKVLKTETGGNDAGLLNPQPHQMEKTDEGMSLPNKPEADRSDLKTQTLDQIVQKAAIHLKNGQHEARIDLKPEFLGHIRMQVVSDNQQVTVKILTEHGFVKDMIENHAHQLKADLQQQGLHVDKLEVSVFGDSDGSGNPKERLAGMRTRPGFADNSRQGNAGQDLPRENRRPRRNAQRTTTVDYFA